MRLIVVVEGQTEEAFVKEVLQPHLANYGVYASATIVGKVAAERRGRGRRGGGHYRHWRRDIERLLGNDNSPDLRVTTLFDLYGLPDDFPGLDEHRHDTNTNRRCDALQSALALAFEDRRLIPYLQRHEFEALVLACLPSLRKLLDAGDDLQGLETLERAVFALDPEEVDDGERTAPSKRLEGHLPGYSKVLHGPMAVADAGLTTVRDRCPRFDGWITLLETLAKNQST
jgi:hypothetical protein